MLSNHPSTLPSGFSATSQRTDTEAGTVESPTQLSEGLTLYRDPFDEGSTYLLADIAVDEDFIAQVGKGWEPYVYQAVDDANYLLEPVGMRIVAASIQRWHSDDEEESLAAHLSSAEQQVRHNLGRLLIVITSQDTVKFDGWAVAARDRVGVQFYLYDPQRSVALIAHEVGHILGARHHEEEEECTSDGCIMNRSGHAHLTSWCEHHQHLIRENVASKLAAQAS